MIDNEPYLPNSTDNNDSNSVNHNKTSLTNYIKPNLTNNKPNSIITKII